MAEPEEIEAIAPDAAFEALAAIPDGECGACEQKFDEQDEAGTIDHDCPDDRQLLVTSAKGDGKTICIRCYYIKRGSFGKQSMGEFMAILKKIPALKAKLLDGEWQSIADYFDEKAPADVKKKVKGLQVQQDDRGVEGVIILPEGKKRKVRVGTKVSNDRIKQSEHETGAQSRSHQDREAAKNVLAMNTKDMRGVGGGDGDPNLTGKARQVLSSFHVADEQIKSFNPS
eukprot:s25_g6.t1